MSSVPDPNCPCMEHPPTITFMNAPDALFVYDEIVTIKHRCRLCGRRCDAQCIPGDYVLARDPD